MHPFYRPALVLLATTLVVSSALSPPPYNNNRYYRTESSSSSYSNENGTSQQQQQHRQQQQRWTPVELHYNPAVRQALDELRPLRRTAIRTLPRVLQSAVQGSVSLTLTLVGYKGGALATQINQDRAVIQVLPDATICMACCDGHAPRGELVAQYAVDHLVPTLLQQKNHNMAQALHDTFLTLDQRVPADPTGGCTATVLVATPDGRIVTANAGDSRTLIAGVVLNNSGEEDAAHILHVTREDKPDLPSERQRVEQAGGSVYIPQHGTSRVVFHDAQTGAPTGLAMSRSLGDWDAGAKGVIPDPVVTTMDYHSLVRRVWQMAGKNNERSRNNGVVYNNPTQQAHARRRNTDHHKNDGAQVRLFAVSATDGVLDYVTPQEIADVMGHALFADDGVHPVVAAEHLLYVAAERWRNAKMGLYRDDMAIAVTVLPPPRGV